MSPERFDLLTPEGRATFNALIGQTFADACQQASKVMAAFCAAAERNDPARATPEEHTP